MEFYGAPPFAPLARPTLATVAARTSSIARHILRLAAVAVLAGGCMPHPAPIPPPAPAPAAPPAPPPFTATEVWSAEPGLVLRGDSASYTVPYAFTRLAVLRADSTGELLVRCPVCRGAPRGRVARERVVWDARPPAAAQQLQLADFALAVRAAALRRDFDALRRVMSRDFIWSLDLPEGSLEAIAAWQGARAADLQRLPALLDRGLVSAGGGVWAAPPEFVTQRGYQDLRAGFRRGSNGWEFVFLVRPELGAPMETGPVRLPARP